MHSVYNSDTIKYSRHCLTIINACQVDTVVLYKYVGNSILDGLIGYLAIMIRIVLPESLLEIKTATDEV